MLGPSVFPDSPVLKMLGPSVFPDSQVKTSSGLFKTDYHHKITNSCDEFVWLTIPEPSRLKFDLEITNSCDEFVWLTIPEP